MPSEMTAFRPPGTPASLLAFCQGSYREAIILTRAGQKPFAQPPDSLAHWPRVILPAMSRRASIWVQATAFVAVLLVAAFLRFWQIDKIPPGFHFDESYEGLEAWKILTDPHYRPVFLTGNFGVLPFNSYANALTFAVMQWLGGEAGPTAMRITAAIFGLLGVLALLVSAGRCAGARLI